MHDSEGVGDNVIFETQVITLTVRKFQCSFLSVKHLLEISGGV